MKTHMCPCGTLRVRLLRTFALPYDRHTSRHRMAKASGAAGGEASRSTVMLASFCWKRGGDHTLLTEGPRLEEAEPPAGSPANNDHKYTANGPRTERKLLLCKGEKPQVEGDSASSPRRTTGGGDSASSPRGTTAGRRLRLLTKGNHSWKETPPPHQGEPNRW
ncbi:hypothetical protein EYF80_049418 [Liparis tanakae]|uniref:Uncharacterized protein n=1 Tax=Liparis tanakae TaxID=230148 RepID=A0A4Z2FI14_9TELE|nr:hypothetical protein EYF80_049418 [Liparis tanakae]